MTTLTDVEGRANYATIHDEPLYVTAAEADKLADLYGIDLATTNARYEVDDTKAAAQAEAAQELTAR